LGRIERGMSNLSEQISDLSNTAEMVENKSRFNTLRYGGVDKGVYII